MRCQWIFAFLLCTTAALACEDASNPPQGAVSGDDLLKAYPIDRSRPHPAIVLRNHTTKPSLSAIVKVVLTQVDPQRALQAYVKGLRAQGDELIDQYCDQAAQQMGGPISDQLRSTIKSEIFQLSQNQDLRDAIAEGLVGALDGFHAPRYFLENLMNHHDLRTITSAAGREVPLFNFSPQSIEMMRLLLEYGNILRNSNVLEFGYGGNPSILKVLSRLPYPLGNIVGVDIDREVGPRPGTEAALAPIHILQGDPLFTSIAPEVKSKGPYRVIYALDTFRWSVSYGIPFLPVPSGAFYLKNLASLLMEGGRIILLNDFKAESVFTAQDVAAAGLTIIEINKERQLRPLELAFMQRIFPGAGNYSFSVFQKGEIKIHGITQIIAVPKAPAQ